MKQRFSSLDVKAVAHELNQSLVSLRLSNTYDLSSRILLLKFAKPGVKRHLLIDIGFRCHLTDYARTTNAPSGFVARVRRILNTRRLTAVLQVGTDRVIEFRFADGQYRLFLEFFASGNVIVTDRDFKILALSRVVPAGEGQEPQGVGLVYSLENRLNFDGVPPLTKERLENALRVTAARAESAAAGAGPKKFKSKPSEMLRKGLATTITELPPIVIDHTLQASGFDATKTATEILASEELLEALLQSLLHARHILDQIAATETCKGYIIAKRKNLPETESARPEDSADNEVASNPKREGLLYEDFQPFLPQKYVNNPEFEVLEFDNFNKTVDEFFSSVEGQRLESKLDEREATARKKLEAARSAHRQRLEGLQEAQTLSFRKAAAIETNAERVQEAMDAVNGLLESGMDWVDVGRLIEREQKRNNPVASMIQLPLKLAEGTITVLLNEEELDDAEDPDETDSDYYSETDDERSTASAARRPASPDKRLRIDIDLRLTPWANARQYYGQRREAVTKEQKTAEQSAVALKNVESKVKQDLSKNLKKEAPVLQPIRQQMWFEKFIWFMSSDGYLVLGSRDNPQSEMLYMKHLRRGDVFCHAEINGAAVVIVKNNPETPDAPIPPSTLSQAGALAVCSSAAWDTKAHMAAWWVKGEQVSKKDLVGQILPAGKFAVKGDKNFLPASQLVMGFGIMFRVGDKDEMAPLKADDREAEDGASVEMDSDDDDDGGNSGTHNEGMETGSPETNQVAESVEVEDGDDGDEENLRQNPLQSQGSDTEAQDVTGSLADISLSGEPVARAEDPVKQEEEDEEEEEEEDGEEEVHEDIQERQQPPNHGTPKAPVSKQAPAKRGQRGKAKKIAAKYKYQDDEDRAAIEALTGTAAGRKRAEEAARVRAEHEAEVAAQHERRRLHIERQKKVMEAHEEARLRMLADRENSGENDAQDDEATSIAANLVGTPRPTDTILEALPVCAPWAALARLKYKVKLQPGSGKKGKAVREILARWSAGSTQPRVVDTTARDPERMWPREVELLKGLRPEECVNCVPTSKVTVVMSGGNGKGKQAGKGGDQGKGKGKGKKK